MKNLLLNNGSSLGRILGNLSSVSDELSQITERLSSGSRINRTSDDPVGVMLNTDLKSKSRLYSKAARNISDTISVTNIMQDALKAQKTTLESMEELANLASNSTISTTQRDAYEEEYEQLLDEYTRIAHSAEFNGQKLLRNNDSDNPESFIVQAGITGSSGDSIPVTLADTTLSGDLDEFIPTFSQVTNTFTEGATIITDYLGLFGSGSVSWTEAQIQSFAGSGTEYAITSGTDGGTPRDVLLLALGGNGDSVTFLTFERNTGDPNRWDTFISPIDALQYINSANNDNGNFGWGPSGYTIKDDYSGTDFSTTDGTIIGGEKIGGSFALTGTTLNSSSNATNAASAIETVKEQVNLVKGAVDASSSRLNIALEFVNQSQINFDFAASKITDIDSASDLARFTQLQVIQNTTTAILASANQSTSLVSTLLQVE